MIKFKFELLIVYGTREGLFHQFIMQLPVVLESMQSVSAGFLMALFLGVAFAASTFCTVDDDLRVEERRTVFGLCLIQQDIFERDFMLLAPLQQLALEVHLLIGKLVDVYEAMHYLLPDEGLAMTVPSVEINSADECFEGVACEIAVVRLVVFVATNQFVETNLCRQSSERLALNDFAACVCQEAFSLAREVMIDNLAYNSIQHGIAKELETLVVDRCAAFFVGEHRLVHQRFLIEAYLVRIEAQHITKGATKLLVLAERKPYRVYQVSGRHSLTLRTS